MQNGVLGVDGAKLVSPGLLGGDGGGLLLGGGGGLLFGGGGLFLGGGGLLLGGGRLLSASSLWMVG